ncbi:hypothetical protein [Streptomyces zaehneri]|uniref:hypothetical protein n=1 Tax=Streptomyces zaehneri TaxID=3051180 RepID=UPI0028D2E001|nr:hypothetical protein [Streptomyces sp. DSM 40713]
MSESQVAEFDETFVALFQHAPPEAAARTAEKLGAEARLSVLRQQRFGPPQGLGDWVAAHGGADEVQALYDGWGLSARQAELVVGRRDLLAHLDNGLVKALGAGRTELAPPTVEQQWRARPAGRFRLPGTFSDAPRPEVEDRVRARLRSDERAWECAFDLLAGGFPGDLPTLLQTALRYHSTVATPCKHVDPGLHVSWLARIAPGDLPARLLTRLGAWPLSEAASGSERARLAPLIANMDNRALWDGAWGGRGSSFNEVKSKDADVERAFLHRDDPRLNEWLLTGITRPELRPAPATRLALLEGRPFGSGTTYPLPRTEAVRARIAFPPPTPWDTGLLRLCYDSREPGLVAQALSAAWTSGEEVLTPYQQLVAGIRLWDAGQADVLATLVPEGPAGIREEGTREAFAQALRLHSAEPLHAAARAHRERPDEHLDEALRTWRLRLPSALGESDLYRLTQSEVAAVSRSITEDRWYDVDWDLVRSRLDAPEASGHRKVTRERYGILLARADCPTDVARTLTDTHFTPLDLSRIYADRDTAIATLSTRCVPAWTLRTGGALAQSVVRAASPQPGWDPAVTVEDVLRHARPARGVVRYADPAAVGRVVTEALEAARSAQDLDEAELWTQLYRTVAHCTVPVPELVRLAAALTGGEERADTLPAAEFVVSPEFDDWAGKVRGRLDVFPSRWARAVRLLAGGFDGPLPALLEAAQRREDEIPRPNGALADHCAPALLLGLAPGPVIETVVARLDLPLCTLLARTTYSGVIVRALVRRGDRQLWDTLIDETRTNRPPERPRSDRFLAWRKLLKDTLIPALLAQDDPRLNARLVREQFAWSTDAERVRAILSGTPFGPGDAPVPVAAELLADFTGWTPDSGRELPDWTSSEHFWDLAEPVLALQALMAVRQTNHQDGPYSRLSLRQSLTAATTIADAGRFDLLQYVIDHWHIRYPWRDHLVERELFEEAVNLRSAEPLRTRLARLG